MTENDNTGEYGILTDYTTGEEIRPATWDEAQQTVESMRSGKHGGSGVFELDGRVVWVAGALDDEDDL